MFKEWFDEGIKTLEASSCMDTAMSHGIVSSDTYDLVNSKPTKKEKARCAFHHILIRDGGFKAYLQYLWWTSTSLT